jgi:hypothetical protein
VLRVKRAEPGLALGPTRLGAVEESARAARSTRPRSRTGSLAIQLRRSHFIKEDIGRPAAVSDSAGVNVQSTSSPLQNIVGHGSVEGLARYDDHLLRGL